MSDDDFRFDDDDLFGDDDDLFGSGEDDLFFRFDLHWSPDGQQLAGMLAAEYIKENGLLKSPETDTP